MKAKMRKGKLVIKVKKGALHKKLGIPQGQTIPAAQEAIKPGDSTKTKQQKQFAINAKTWHH